MTKSLKRPDRRQFLQQATAMSGALVLGFHTSPALATPAITAHEVTHWVVIQPDDTVLIRIARSELGQGTMTGLAMLVAEELECDWANVRTEYANVNEHMRRDKIWKDMTTAGSRGIRDSHEYVRQAGAAARTMLITAAAQQWKVPTTSFGLACEGQWQPVVRRGHATPRHVARLHCSKPCVWWTCKAG